MTKNGEQPPQKPATIAWFDLKEGQEIQIFHIKYKILGLRSYEALLKTLNGTHEGKETLMNMLNLLSLLEKHKESELAGTLDKQIDIRRKADEYRRTHFKGGFSTG